MLKENIYNWELSASTNVNTCPTKCLAVPETQI